MRKLKLMIGTRKKRKRKKISSRAKSAHYKFTKAVDRCIIVASKAPSGARLKALGRCVNRELKRR